MRAVDSPLGSPALDRMDYYRVLQMKRFNGILRKGTPVRPFYRRWKAFIALPPGVVDASHRRLAPSRSVTNLFCLLAALLQLSGTSATVSAKLERVVVPADVVRGTPPRNSEFSQLRGASVLTDHFSCDLNVLDDEDVSATEGEFYLPTGDESSDKQSALQQALEACQPPVDAWMALIEAERGGLHLVQTATSPPFLMFTLDPRVDGGMSFWLHRYGMLEPYKQEWLRRAGIDEAQVRGSDHLSDSPRMVDVGAGLGFFGLYALALGFRAHFVEPSMEHIIRCSLRMNGWALGSHALITPVLEPKSLDELLHDDGDIAALKLDLDPGKDTTALLGAGSLFKESRVRRLVASVWSSTGVSEALEMLQEAGYTIEQVAHSHDDQWARWISGDPVFLADPVVDLADFTSRLEREPPHMREISCVSSAAISQHPATQTIRQAIPISPDDAMVELRSLSEGQAQAESSRVAKPQYDAAWLDDV